jgi:Sulfotransferase family
VTEVLIVGVPRSGTSWIGRVLGSAPGAVYLGEPDNHEHVPFALRAKLGAKGRLYPYLDPAEEAPVYGRLWRDAFAGGHADGLVAAVRTRAAERLLRGAESGDLIGAIVDPAAASLRLRLAAALALPEQRPSDGSAVVVKSVHAQLALDWLATRFPVRILIVLREPLNVLSSWKAMGWLAAPGVLDELGPAAADDLARALNLEMPSPESPVEEAALLIALLTAALSDAAQRHPDWLEVSHESLCERPHELFPTVAAALGLGWDERVDALLDDLNRPGSGYETTRVATGLREVWRTRLTPDEVEAAAAIFERLGVARDAER